MFHLEFHPPTTPFHPLFFHPPNTPGRVEHPGRGWNPFRFSAPAQVRAGGLVDVAKIC